MCRPVSPYVVWLRVGPLAIPWLGMNSNLRSFFEIVSCTTHCQFPLLATAQKKNVEVLAARLVE